MASSSPVCGICDSRHICKTSKVWCSECDEGLCIDCTEHHSRSKGTRNHNTMHIAEYQKLPSYVLDVKEFCQEHKDRFQFYCELHGCPFCRICMLEDHRQCKDVSILEHVIKNVKTSVTFNEIEQLIDELTETIGKIKQNRENNSADVSEQKRVVEHEIWELRAKINKHLDKLQEDLMKELTEAETKIQVKTSELLSSLDKKKKELAEYQTNMVNIKLYASDLQTFLSMKQIESSIETHDTYIHALVNSESLNQTILSCKIDTWLKNIITTIGKVGEVVVESKPCELTFVGKNTNKPR